MLLYQIALTLLPNIGPKTGKELVAYCGGVEAVFSESKKNLVKIPRIGEEIANSVINGKVLQRAEEEINFIEKRGIRAYFYLDSGFPERLKHCDDHPLMLYYKGNGDWNASKVVAIVGTRKSSDYGKIVCEQLIKGLSHHDDLLIISGLAYGIDSCAHRLALDNSIPTMAVIGHGLDRIYPPVNKGMAAKMVENGGLVSEFPSKTTPDRENFPRRNRIIAGMVDAVVVVESGGKGGALITADIANSYNRDVFAVPGKIHDTYSQGCNNLIKTNRAALVESAADIEYIMRWDKAAQKKQNTQRKLFLELSEEEERVVNALRKEGTMAIDELILETNMSSSRIVSSLLNLEFEGAVKCLPGNVYRLID
ncbi:MAG: DNA-processing protein DprA [Bacteroidales bacterium]|nr:DNA-processing protein DprA [Bacteroidales bacterium]